MSLMNALLAALAVFAVLNYAFIPAVKAAWIANRSLAKIQKAGIIAGLETARTFALVAVITYVALCAVLLMLKGRSALTPENVVSALAWAVTVRQVFAKFQEVWSLLVFGVSFCALAVLAYWGGRRHLEMKFDARVRSEVERLRALRQTDEQAWQELPPTGEMLTVLAKIEQMTARLEALRADGQESTSEVAQLTTQVNILVQYFESLDLSRRMDLRWESEPLQAKGFLSRLRNSLISRGLLDDMKGAQKLFSRLGSAMLLLSLVSLHSSGIAAVADGRIVALEQFQVEVSLHDSAAKLEKVRRTAENAQSQGREKDPVSQYIAWAFERRFASNPIWRRAPVDLAADAALRRQIVRVQLQDRTARGEAIVSLAKRLDSKDFNDVEREVVRSFVTAEAPGGPRTKLGQQFVKDWAADGVSGWRKLRDSLEQKVAEHAAKYTQVASLHDLQEWFIGEAIGRALDVTLPTVEPGLAAQGQGAEGMAHMHRGLAARRATGAELGRPLLLTLMAEAYGGMERAKEGLALLAEALAVVNNSRERHWEAELYRLKGELLLAPEGKRRRAKGKRQPWGEAEACFHQALEIARRQQAKSWELRAALSLSHLWQRQDKRAAASELLAPIYDWFTEGLDTADLQEAKALLDVLV
jgi:hypothetical protein